MGAALSTIQAIKRTRRRWSQRLARSNAFAWGISIGVHAVVFAVLYPFVYSEEVQTRRVIIPEARLAPISEAPPEQTAVVRVSPPPPQAPAFPSDDRLIAAERLPSSLIDTDVLPSPPIPSSQPSVLSGLSSPSAAGPQGPVSSFFGVAGNAYRVVYVVDVSGSLVGALHELTTEMARSVQALIPTQQFNIVLTYGNQVHEFRPAALVWANAEQKRAATDFLAEMVASLGAKPVEAMERAFAARPELIYFLSDGDHEWDAVQAGGRTSLEKKLDELNRDRAVKITVIGFEPSPGPPLTLLERIARENGGNYRTVGVKSLRDR